MAATNAKANTRTAPIAPTGNGQPQGGVSTADTKLLNYVRGNSQQIVASITLAASQAGEQRDWPQMNEYLAIANQISGLCGLGQVQTSLPAGRPQTMAAQVGG